MKPKMRGLVNKNFYYGWVIVAVALVSMAFWLGIRSSFSVFYVALLEEFSWNRGESAGVQSMALITYTLLAPAVGSLIDRFGPRRVIVPGILILSFGLILCATINTLAQFYVLYGVFMGTGITCIGIVSYSAILAHWFEKKRGLASGIAVSGMGLGTFALVPISQNFISQWGWRVTFMITGALVLIILLPLNALLMRHKPEEVGQHPDGIDESHLLSRENKNHIEKKSKEEDWTPKKAMETGRFWALIFFPFLSIIAIYMILVHNVKFLVDQGISKMNAALFFAAIGVISSIFRVIWGGLSDRIGREITYTFGMGCLCVGIGSLILIETTGSKNLVYAFVFFFGMGWGASAPLFMAVAADLFKGRIFGFIYGIVEGGIGIGGALGAWVGGYIYDETQSYQWAFMLAISAAVISSFIVWFASPRKVRIKTHES